MPVALPSQEIKNVSRYWHLFPGEQNGPSGEPLHETLQLCWPCRGICIGFPCCSSEGFYFLSLFADTAFRAGHGKQEGSCLACDDEHVPLNDKSCCTHSPLCTQHPHLLELFPVAQDEGCVYAMSTWTTQPHSQCAVMQTACLESWCNAVWTQLLELNWYLGALSPQT